MQKKPNIARKYTFTQVMPGTAEATCIRKVGKPGWDYISHLDSPKNLSQIGSAINFGLYGRDLVTGDATYKIYSDRFIKGGFLYVLNQHLHVGLFKYFRS